MGSLTCAACLAHTDGCTCACAACGETHGPEYGACIADRVQMTDKEHAEAIVDRLIASSVQAAMSKRALQPAPSLRCLAANLAVGGALCAAYWIGYDAEGFAPHHWRPGCGRAWGVS